MPLRTASSRLPVQYSRGTQLIECWVKRQRQETVGERSGEDSNPRDKREQCAVCSTPPRRVAPMGWNVYLLTTASIAACGTTMVGWCAPLYKGPPPHRDTSAKVVGTRHHTPGLRGQLPADGHIHRIAGQELSRHTRITGPIYPMLSIDPTYNIYMGMVNLI